MAMPEEAFHQDYSEQSKDSGDRQHCDDRHHFYSGKCSVTQQTTGDQNMTETLSPDYNIGGPQTTLIRAKPFIVQNE